MELEVELEDVELGDDSRCPLAEALIEMLCMAEISFLQANWLARCARQSDPEHRDLVGLAEIGNSGAHAGNLRRDFLRRFRESETLPSPLYIEDVPAVNNIGTRVLAQQSILPIMEFVEAMFNEHREQWDAMFGVNPRSFWDQVSPNDPRLPFMGDLTGEAGWEDRTWPCILHGDGGVYTRKTEDSVLCISMKSMLNDRFGKDILPLIVLPKHMRCRDDGHNTADELWKALVHQLNAAGAGRHTATDHRGTPWSPNSRRGCLVGKRLWGGDVRLVFFCITGDLGWSAL